MRRGRPGLRVCVPPGLIAVGFPAANGLSRIFECIGNAEWRNVYTFESMHGPLDCDARESRSPCDSVAINPKVAMTRAVNGRRNSSTTVMRRMLASMKTVEGDAVGGSF